MSFLFGSLTSLTLIFFWGLFYYSRDPHHERFQHILKTVLFGFISFFLSIIIILPTSALFGLDTNTIDILFYSGNIYVVVALAASEEISKLLIIRHIILKSKQIKEHTDGVFYGGLLGLGFALIENIFYAVSINYYSSLVRALLIPLLHSATGAVLGFFLIEKRLHDKVSHNQHAWIAFGITTFFHALYNYFVIITTKYSVGFMLTMIMWIGLLLLVALVTNTSRMRDFDHEQHTSEDIIVEKSEEGKTYCFLGLFTSLLALFMIFPAVLGPVGIILGLIGFQQGAIAWGRRAIRFGIAATVIGYIGSIVILYI
ncbi:PrsW family intramembrane metalloprotease [candidate division WWE3 bacterium]|uniref:PrsW family intramembrane metalloprotease n=1 Tax=candidate division WWE3 bacterium TaxID=2053526 RepID=A0A955LW95_UNCKA|nr:PrsW family intramembrane metalloprotease [candidate division WWE3 bacterium]